MINTISDQDPTLDTITRITPSMCVFSAKGGCGDMCGISRLRSVPWESFGKRGRGLIGWHVDRGDGGWRSGVDSA
jgi:hypothetical protein